MNKKKTVSCIYIYRNDVNESYKHICDNISKEIWENHLYLRDSHHFCKYDFV